MAGSSFSTDKPEQPRCMDELICSIKPTASSNGEASSFLAEGVLADYSSRAPRQKRMLASSAIMEIWQKAGPSSQKEKNML
jgi:hypothetical protein